MFDLKKLKYFDKKEVFEKFEDFKKMLIDCNNNKFNLTTITSDEEVYIKHFFDSLKGESQIKKSSKIIEIGSGGGFPSIPLKIYRDDLNFTLCEATGKKCDFLNEVKREFKFDNFEILNVRCEDLAKNENYREKFDVAVARAVAKLNTLCEYLLPFVKVGGIMIAYKGDCGDELLQAEKAIEILGGKFKEKIDYELENSLGNRSLVIIEKIRNTPSKYPRGNGKERSKPL